MTAGSIVLAHKTDRHLFILLRFTRGKKRRPQWSYTEDLREASTFDSEHEAEAMQRKHRVPPTAAAPRQYTTAFSDWLRALEFPPEKRERQTELL